MPEITLLGDLAPVGIGAFSTRPAASGSELVLGNLETPLCTAATAPRPKAGPHLRADPAVATALNAAWPNLVVAFANNHAADYGADGIAQTVQALSAAGIRCVGAGTSLQEATRPLFVTCGGLRVAMVSLCDRWSGLAESDRAGVAPLSAGLAPALARLRTQADRVILSVHGGPELSSWPSPRWQELLRSAVDAGADIVHAHHPHVSQGWEHHGRGWIFYGLGNTLAHPAGWPNVLTRFSLQARLDLSDLERPPMMSAWNCDADGDALVLRQVATLEEGSPEATVRNRPLGDPLLLEGLHQEYALRLWSAFYADRLSIGETTRHRLRTLARAGRDIVQACLVPGAWRRHLRARRLFHHHLFSTATHADELATALAVLSGERTDRRTPETRALADRLIPAALFH